MGAMPEKWEIVSWDMFYDIARNLAFAIQADNFQPDIIIAIARGGYTPARILSDYLGVMDMSSFKVKHYHSAHKSKQAIIEHPLQADINAKKVLLVDDVCDSGDTFEVGIQHIKESFNPAEIKTAVLHQKIVAKYTPDYYTREVKEWHWITYPWARMEDLTEFIKNSNLTDSPAEEIRQQLNHKFTIEIPEQMISDALLLIQRDIWK